MMCEFCKMTLTAKEMQYGKLTELKKTASETDMIDCQILIHKCQKPALVIFDRKGRAAFIEISNCPKCGRDLAEENTVEIKPVIHAHAIINWLGDCKCSNCESMIDVTEPYCQHCGATLDEPEERED